MSLDGVEFWLIISVGWSVGGVFWAWSTGRSVEKRVVKFISEVLA